MLDSKYGERKRNLFSQNLRQEESPGPSLRPRLSSHMRFLRPNKNYHQSAAEACFHRSKSCLSIVKGFYVLSVESVFLRHPIMCTRIHVVAMKKKRLF